MRRILVTNDDGIHAPGIQLMEKLARGLCEREVPPVRDLAPGHQVKCHLSQEMFDRMEPVIRVAAE